MITIRTAKRTDSTTLFALATSFTPEGAAFEIALETLLESPDAYLVVATQDEKVVGYLL